MNKIAKFETFVGTSRTVDSIRLGHAEYWTKHGAWRAFLVCGSDNKYFGIFSFVLLNSGWSYEFVSLYMLYCVFTTYCS